MKKGKQLGLYSFRATSNRVRDDDKLEINFEGTVSGFGFVVLTMTATVGSGRWEAYEVVYRDDGTITTASGKGEHKITGKFKWDTTGVIKADGRTFIAEGTMELATKNWSGKY